MSQGDRRAMAQGELADELDRLAAGYRALAGTLDLARACGIEVALDLDCDLARALDLDRALARALARALDRDLACDLARDLDLAHARARALEQFPFRDLGADAALARDLANDLTGGAGAMRAYHQHSKLSRRDDRVEARVLGWLARALPASERSLFVAEERGNLADCERWCERVARLTDLAIEMPRLAWQLRRGGWRERA